MSLKRRSIVWVDANGFTRQTLLTGSATLAGVQSALFASSNADVLTDWEGDLDVNPLPSPINAAFNSVKDAAILVFSTTGMELVSVTLPAPQDNIFYSDMQTVNPANIATIIAAVLATETSQSGDACVAYVSGTRVRS